MQYGILVLQGSAGTTESIKQTDRLVHAGIMKSAAEIATLLLQKVSCAFDICPCQILRSSSSETRLTSARLATVSGMSAVVFVTGAEQQCV